MATYVLPERTCLIEFDDYPGLEVEMLVSPIPIGEYIEGTKYVDELAERLATIDDLYALADFVAKYLRRSTLDTPPREWPHQLLLSCALAWSRAVGQVMPPLPRLSSGTASSRESTNDRPSSTRRSSSTRSSDAIPATP